jgi:hypothetical protein
MNPVLPLYVAAPGMLAQGGEPSAWRVISLALSPYAMQVVHRGMYLSDDETRGLHAQQLDLVDLLVLSRCRAFVGLNTSSFSTLVREHRYAMGYAKRSTAHLVPGPKTPIDEIMRNSAVL